MRLRSRTPSKKFETVYTLAARHRERLSQATKPVRDCASQHNIVIAEDQNPWLVLLDLSYQKGIEDFLQKSLLEESRDQYATEKRNIGLIVCLELYKKRILPSSTDVFSVYSNGRFEINKNAFTQISFLLWAMTKKNDYEAAQYFLHLLNIFLKEGAENDYFFIKNAVNHSPEIFHFLSAGAYFGIENNIKKIPEEIFSFMLKLNEKTFYHLSEDIILKTLLSRPFNGETIFFILVSAFVLYSKKNNGAVSSDIASLLFTYIDKHVKKYRYYQKLDKIKASYIFPYLVYLLDVLLRSNVFLSKDISKILKYFDDYISLCNAYDWKAIEKILLNTLFTNENEIFLSKMLRLLGTMADYSEVGYCEQIHYCNILAKMVLKCSGSSLSDAVLDSKKRGTEIFFLAIYPLISYFKNYSKVIYDDLRDSLTRLLLFLSEKVSPQAFYVAACFYTKEGAMFFDFISMFFHSYRIWKGSNAPFTGDFNALMELVLKKGDIFSQVISHRSITQWLATEAENTENSYRCRKRKLEDESNSSVLGRPEEQDKKLEAAKIFYEKGKLELKNAENSYQELLDLQQTTEVRTLVKYLRAEDEKNIKKTPAEKNPKKDIFKKSLLLISFAGLPCSSGAAYFPLEMALYSILIAHIELKIGLDQYNLGIERVLYHADRHNEFNPHAFLVIWHYFQLMRLEEFNKKYVGKNIIDSANEVYWRIRISQHIDRELCFFLWQKYDEISKDSSSREESEFKGIIVGALRTYPIRTIFFPHHSPVYEMMAATKVLKAQ